MQDIRTSTPFREETRSSYGEVMENGRTVSPREERAAFAAFETDVGRVREIMLAGGIGGEASVDRRPSTMERPVWPVAPTIAIVRTIVGE